MSPFLSYLAVAILRIRRSVALALALLALVLGHGPAAAPAPAGLRIVNTAHVSYFHTGLGLRETVSSNTVEAVVQAVPALHLEGGSERSVQRGVSARQDFVVSNMGNTALDVWPRITLGRDDAPLMNQRLYWDRNADGRIDHDDPQVTDTAIPLAFGAKLRLIFLFDIEPAAALNDTATLRLRARAEPRMEGPLPLDVMITGTAQGRVTIVESGLELHKSVLRLAAPDGEILTYELTLQNDGQTAVGLAERIEGDAILVDDMARPGLLVRDPMPLNTAFAAPGAAPGSVALYHREGDPAHSYVSTPPEDPAEIDAVAFLVEQPLEAGHTRKMSFQVRVSDHAGPVDILNSATVFVPQSDGTRPEPSNEVVVGREAQGGGLSYVDPGLDPVFRGTLGEDLTLRLGSGGCNTTRGRDRIEINVVSRRTGDLETVIAVETGANTGLFTAPPLPVTQMATPVAGDNVLAATRGDLLVATAICGSMQYAAEFEIDPGNFVFSSIDNAPVAGARVALLDQAGREVEIAMTDEEGFFALGDQARGRYRYSVDAPGHAYPSVRRVFEGFARQLSSSRASWGGMFSHAAGPLMQGDVPVDPSYGIPIAVEKQVDRQQVGTGGHAVYTLSLRNEMTVALTGAQLLDTPPFGTRIVAGSATLDGQRIDDPARRDDGVHAFEIGLIAPGAVRELRYALRFGPAARAGDNRNIARLQGRQVGTGRPLVSAAAQAVVRLDDRGGVFAEQATITGSVFLDCDGDGLRGGADEMGVPGVRIATQGGLFAVTDIDGQYSLRNLPPHLHALSPSRSTLPAGAAIARSRSGDTRSGGTRMVALKRGELRAEHFAVAGCDAVLRAEVAERVATFAARQGRATLEVSDLPSVSRAGDARAPVTEAGRATASQIYRRTEPVAPSPAAAPAPRIALSDAIRDYDQAPAFLDIEDGARLDRRVVSLRVKGPADLDLALRLNGAPVPFDRIGEKTTWAAGNVQAIDYVALELEEGRNELVLVGVDPFGNERANLAIALHAPGAPAGLVIEAPETAPASAGAAIPVSLQLTDRAGHPVMSSAVVSLRATLGEWDATDLQPDEPGLQVFVAEGRAELILRAPQVPGRGRLFATADIGAAQTDIVFVPDLAARDLVGVIEATAPLGGELVSPFEHGHDGLSGEVYLRGAVGDTLVTLHYDSRAEAQGLLGGGTGDDGFPVFGDASEQGFDARSSTGLYLRLDRAGSSFVHGDIATAPSLEGFRLGGGGRIVNGAKYALEAEHVALTLFAARTGQSQRSVEIAGRGITGPYPVDLSDMIGGSDRAWRVTRDRDTGEILQEVPLERLTDYVLDYFTDSLILDVPLKQADEDGHPVSVRLVFETEGTAERYWLYGGDVIWTPAEDLEIGARIQHADAARGTPQRERLQAVYMRRRIDDGTSVELEVARMQDGAGRAGAAGRLRIARERASWQGELELTHAGRDFAPASAPVRPHTSEIDASLTRTLASGSRVQAEASLHRNHAADSGRASLRAAHEYDVSSRLTRRNEIRALRETGPASRDTTLWLGTGAVWRPATDRPLEFDLLLEQSVWGGEEGLLSFGMDHELTRHWSISGEAELGLAIDGTVGDLRRLRLASEYDVADWLRGRTEITRSDGGTPDSRLVQGFQADWTRGPWTLGLGLEHSEPVEGDGDRLTSLALSADWRAEDETWIVETDVGRSFEPGAASLSTDVGVAGRISSDWTFLGRSRFSREERDGAPDRRRNRLRVGAAYRPVHDPRLDLLAWYEHRFEREQAEESEHLWSVAGSWQAGPDLQINGRYSGRLAGLDLDAGATGMTRDEVMTQLAQVGANLDLFDDRIMLGANLARIWDDQGAATNAYGGELGLAVGDGAMISVGYNATRRTPKGAEALHDDGAYVRVRMALGEGLWDRLADFLNR